MFKSKSIRISWAHKSLHLLGSLVSLASKVGLQGDEFAIHFACSLITAKSLMSALCGFTDVTAVDSRCGHLDVLWPFLRPQAQTAAWPPFIPLEHYVG